MKKGEREVKKEDLEAELKNNPKGRVQYVLKQSEGEGNREQYVLQIKFCCKKEMTANCELLLSTQLYITIVMNRLHIPYFLE